MQKAKTLLKNIFGYDSFRPLQQEIIQNVLNKKDSLVIMPTGGGKSLCYQIPALLFNGLTIVISPLISLMKDQVEQLRQLGIETAILNSSLSPKEIRDNLISIKSNRAKLLYIAPESLVKEENINLLKSINIECITVDEAHCISEWGHDFRPEYRQIGKLRKSFPNSVCIALTATATPRVQEDIAKNLNIPHESKFIASFNRDNLFLQVIPKQNSFDQTVMFLNEHKDQSGIIYCFSRKQVDSLYKDLLYLGYSCKPYHAGLNENDRNINQELFIKDEVQIIIATIAFGMGINKSNVRFVLHHDLPKNLESYYQEIGRAGRDGLKADCLLLFSYADIAKINYFIDQKENENDWLVAKDHLNAMVKYAESNLCRRIPLINYFGEKYNIPNCVMCDNCVTEAEDLTDITVASQKFLSAVKRTNEIYGAIYLIDILTGVESEKIIHNRHHNLQVFGIGKEYNKKQWQAIAHQLINKEYLKRGIEFGSLKLTKKAYDVLGKEEKVFGIMKEASELVKKKKTASEVYNKELFDILRRKRKDIADHYGIPPFVIFSDKSLTQMASVMPQNKKEFLAISGVGEAKLKRYGDQFLAIIKEYATNNIDIPIAKPKGVSKSKTTKKRHIEIGELYNEGISINSLMDKYNVHKQTIISNLYKYVTEVKKVRTDGLAETIYFDNEIKEEIINAFKELGTEKLIPVFEKLNGRITYDNLHIMRLLFLCGYKTTKQNK